MNGLDIFYELVDEEMYGHRRLGSFEGMYKLSDERGMSKDDNASTSETQETLEKTGGGKNVEMESLVRS